VIMRPFLYASYTGLASLMIALAGNTAEARAAELTATCPAKIPANSFVPAAVPKGWTGFVPRPLFLTGAGMMAGPPEELEYLVPNKTFRQRQVFDFQHGDRQRWMWCLYSDGVQLSQRLNEEAARCTITTTGKIADASLNATVKCTKP
jgi:hypothetical protein